MLIADYIVSDMSLCARFSDLSLRAPSEETASPGGDEPRVRCSVSVRVLREPDATGRCLVFDGSDGGRATVPWQLLLGYGGGRDYDVTYEFWGTIESTDENGQSIVQDPEGNQFYDR